MPLRLVHSAVGAPLAPQWRFTSHDLIALNEYMRDMARHGYVKSIVEPGSGADVPEHAPYVLIYRANQAWAEWGLARVGTAFEVWHCATGANAGRFATMHAALDSLPLNDPPTPRERESNFHPLIAYR